MPQHDRKFTDCMPTGRFICSIPPAKEGWKKKGNEE
jgi:hypothetical protein